MPFGQKGGGVYVIAPWVFKSLFMGLFSMDAFLLTIGSFPLTVGVP